MSPRRPRRRRRRRPGPRRDGRVALAVVAAAALGASALIVVGIAVSADEDLCGRDLPTSGTRVAGYGGEQLANAAVIVDTASELGLGRAGQVLGVMAAMGESGLRNLPYGDFETSGARNPDGSPTTSVGLFQQQDSWGTLEARLDPATSARLFFDRLVRVPGWEQLPPTEAIHRVQVNSDPDHYARWEDEADEVVTALSARC